MGGCCGLTTQGTSYINHEMIDSLFVVGACDQLKVKNSQILVTNVTMEWPYSALRSSFYALYKYVFIIIIIIIRECSKVLRCIFVSFGISMGGLSSHTQCAQFAKLGVSWKFN